MRAAVPAGYVTPTAAQAELTACVVFWNALWSPGFWGLYWLADEAGVSPHAILGVLERRPVAPDVLRDVLATVERHRRETDQDRNDRRSRFRLVRARGSTRTYFVPAEPDASDEEVYVDLPDGSYVLARDAPRAPPWPTPAARDAARARLRRLDLPPWSTDELARALRVHPRTVERRCEDGEIAARKVPGRGKSRGRWLVPDPLARDAIHAAALERRAAAERAALCPSFDDPKFHGFAHYATGRRCAASDPGAMVVRCACYCRRCALDHAMHREPAAPAPAAARPSNWGDAREFAADRRRVVAFVRQHAPRQDRAATVAAYNHLAPRMPQLKREAERPLAWDTVGDPDGGDAVPWVETLAHTGEGYEPEDD